MNGTEVITFLSKSRFIRGLQCHKALWLQTYRPELLPVTPPEIQALFDTGNVVGKMAQKLFPGGIEVPFEGMELSAQIAMTQELMASGVDTIFEAAFSFERVFVKADILHRVPKGWRLGEVKSSSSAKEVFVNDVAVQYHVIAGCGVPIESAGLLLLEKPLSHRGAVGPGVRFTWVDITTEILARQEMVIVEADRMRGMLAAPEPSIVIGPHCSKPYKCPFRDHCRTQ